MNKKKKKLNWKKFWATVVILFVAFIFTVSIFISYSGGGGEVVEMEVIAEVNGKPVEFYANSPVVREYERLRELYKTRTKEEILSKAVQNVVASMLIEDFAKHNGLDLSEEFIDRVTADNIHSFARKTEVSSSEIKLVRLNVESYLKSSYLPTKIDTFVNRIPKKSQASLHLLKTLDDLKIAMDIINFDETEFIRLSELTDNPKGISDFYLANYKNIALDAKITIKAEKYIFGDRKSAYSFVSNGSSSFEEKSLVELDPERNKNIILGLPEDINSFSKPLFENKKYVVYKVVSIPSFESLPQKSKDYISLKHTTQNIENLMGKYSESIKDTVNTLKRYLSAGNFEGIRKIKGVKVYRTGNFSIIKALTEFIPDQKGEAIDLPRGAYNISLITSWFTKNPGDIDIADIGQGTKIIYKILNKQVIPSRLSEIVDKLFSSYQFLYQEVIYSEWNKMLEKSGNVKIKDISKFAKEL
ncbi:MAG: SurA N-terminal domain-containing protein [Brevinematia bacterium]